MGKNNALQEGLHRGLEERHIQLIALGGAIGVGLFLGAGAAIKTAGPSLILVYFLAGIIMFYIMRALGEVAVAYPVSGTFSAHSNIFLGPLTGYITGWTYWFMWVVTCMAEITAVGVYVSYWLPEVPQWIPALLALIIMAAVNVVSVRAFGEFEFWFALIKVVTILAMIIAGSAMILFGIANQGVAIGISNLWSYGGFFPYGLEGMAMASIMVMFSYLGIELIGVTAGEAKNPEKSLPAAIDKVFWRILIFYVGSLFVIMSLYPWNQIGTIGSPFVLTFNKLGIRAAAGIINFVVLTAALSSCNSGLFSTGRMLYNLALQGKAPAVFSTLNSRQVPVRGILVSSGFLLIGVVLNYLIPAQVFVYVTSVATFGALWIWAVILLIQMKYRAGLNAEQISQIKYPMPFSPLSNWISLLFLAFVAIAMFFNADTRIALYIAPIWFGMLVASYYGLGMHKDDNRVKTFAER